MYQAHFKLNEMPFQLVPDTRLFFGGGYRGDVLTGLQYAIMNGDGIIKVVGEVGSGKTMLCRMLEKQLPESVDVVYIANPSISPDNILNTIAFELQLTQQPCSKLEVMQLLQGWLLKRHAAGRRVVLFIEEAQGMPLATLEEVRLLCNLETEQDKLLQIVLFGQPELDANLTEPSIRQLRERVAHHFYLTPFDAKATHAYLNYRMQMAGYQGAALFSRRHANLLHRYSQGLVRRINLLADKSLLAAYAGGSHRIRNQYIRMAAKDSQFTAVKGAWSPWSQRLGALSAGLLLALFGLYSWPWLSKYLSQPSDNTMLAKASNIKTTSAVQSVIAEVNQIPKTDNDSEERVLVSQIEEENPIVFEPLVTKTVNADKPENFVLETVEPEIKQQTVKDTIVDDIETNELTWIEHAKNANQQWLDKKNNTTRAIQIMSLSKTNIEQVENFLVELNDYSELDSTKIKLYESVIKGKPVLNILYGEYPNRKLAFAAMAALPERLKRQGPFLVRSVKGVKDEISASTS